MNALLPGVLAFVPVVAGDLEVRLEAPPDLVAAGARIDVRLLAPRGVGISSGRLMGWPIVADERGIAVLHDVPPGEYEIWVHGEAGGYGTVAIDVLGDDRIEATVVLAPGRTVSGKVLDAEGRAIASARVSTRAFRFSEAARFVTKSTYSDPDGYWQLLDLPPREHFDWFDLAVVVEAPGYARERLTIAGATLDAVLRLVPLAGRLVDEFEQPIAGAQVFVEDWAGTVAYDTSDDAGRFSLDLRRGSIRSSVQVRLDGREGEALPMRGDECVFQLRIPPPIRGSVERWDGAPAVGAEVALLQGGQESWFDTWHPVAADGSFGLPVSRPGTYAVAVRHPDLPRVVSPRFDVSVVAATAPLTMRLEPGATVRGQVTDRSTGSPIRGALVHIIEDRSLRCTTPEEIGARRRIVWTDAAGGFVIAGLPCGPHLLAVHHPGYVAEAEREVDCTRGEELDVGVLAITPGVVVRGIVRDADGSPVPRAVVMMNDPRVSRFTHDVVADERGRFRVLGVPRGTICALAVPPHPAGVGRRFSSSHPHFRIGDGNEAFLELVAGR